MEDVADITIPNSYYEKTGLMKFSLKRYKEGNYSLNYTKTDQLLLNFIEVRVFFFI